MVIEKKLTVENAMDIMIIYLKYKKTAHCFTSLFQWIFTETSLGHVGYLSFMRIIIVKLTGTLAKNDTYFEFHLFTHHIFFDGHNDTFMPVHQC
jgi:hypothetical protein